MKPDKKIIVNLYDAFWRELGDGYSMSLSAKFYDAAYEALDQLRRNGVAVVELPEPDAELPHPLWALVFDDIHADDGQVVTHTPGGVYRSVETPKQARERAAALLAAADYAEREQ